MPRRTLSVALIASILALIAAPAQSAQAKKKRRKPNPALKPIQDRPGLPRVLLIGDSISIGYTLPVRKLLAGEANVHRPQANCGPTSRGVEQLDRWLGKGDWDVIHFNWGLHDLKVMPDGQHQVPLDAYEENLRKLLERLEKTGATLIWCSTTPVPAGKLRPPRSNEDVVAYNAVARKIMDEHDVAIDDLYAFALPRLKQIQRPVNVHFTEKGSAELAKQVAASIRKALLGKGSTDKAKAPGSKRDHLAVVRGYVDAVLAHGRDAYGKVHSPLLAVTLDRKTMNLPSGAVLERLSKLKRESWGIRPHDRMLTGANPMHDQNLYQVMVALSQVTGDARYAAEADKTLAWFFEHGQSPATGLMAWGEHIGWDFKTESIIDKPAGTTHEYFRPWVLWDRCFKLAPKPAKAFALGVWQHQIGDQATGNFSRHARYDKHGPGTNSEYPRHGGFYIATWASAYRHTKDPVFCKAIETLVTYFTKRRSPKTDAIPAESASRSKGEMMWPQSNLSLAIDLWDGAACMPDALAATMRDVAARTDKVFLRLPHDLGPNGKGFNKIASTHTLDVRKWGARGAYTDLWATGYGDATDATIGNLCMLRYRQVKLDGYKRLVVDAARRYLTAEPDIAFPIYPGTLGDVIFLLLAGHELTGDAAFLDRADVMADRAIAMFFEPGCSLPKASSKHDHYEAITRADTLAMALLKLWIVRNTPDLDVELVYNDR